MGVVHAAVEAGGASISADVTADATHAKFRMRLLAGPAKLLTTLRRTDGTEHGAYFATIRRVD